MSDETLVPLKTPHPDEQNQFLEVGNVFPYSHRF